MADPLFGPYNTPIRDSFPVDGDPGSGWVGDFFTGYPRPSVIRGRLDAGDVASAARRPTPTASADCEVWATPEADGGNPVTLVARGSSTVGTLAGYGYGVNYAGTGLTLNKKSPGIPVFIARAYGSAIPANAPIALACVESTIQAFYWDGAKWVLSCSFVDTDDPVPGYTGVLLGGAIDNYGDGSIALGTALAPYRCRAVWDNYQSGLLTFGYSEFDGADVFAPSPFAATYLGPYDDLSAMLASAEVTIGRDSNLTWLPASSAQITLRDPTGLLNPENVSGPLYTALRADRMHPITLEGVFGGTHSIFSGWIREITWEPTKRKGYAHLDCVDLTYSLNKAYPIIAATGATTTGAAIGLILDAIDWTDTGLRDLDVGDSIPDFSADGSQTALSLVEGLLDCERGTFYIAPDGVATYRDRSWRQTLDSVALIEDEMSFVAPGVDFDSAITRARVTRLQSGYIAEALAPANDQRKLGWNDLPPIETPYLIADAGADSLAQSLIWSLGQPRPPMHDLALDNRTAYQLYQILARAFGDRITVSSSQTGQSGDYLIEQIRHAIGGTPRHVCNLLVSRVVPQAILFGVSAFDGPDVFVY